MSRIDLKIHKWPDPILRTKCRDVETMDKDIRDILDAMYGLMVKSDGIGLAATQVGMDISLIVIEAEDRLFRLANPKIIKREGVMVFEEGCLSFPGLNLKIKRSSRIWVNALDYSGEEVTIEAEDIMAVVFQHEIDHINGKVFIDRTPFFKRIGLLNRKY